MLNVRPSSLSRVARCPASGVLSDGLPSPGNDYTAIGTCGHAIIADMLNGRKRSTQTYLDEYEISGLISVEDMTSACEWAYRWAHDNVLASGRDFQTEVKLGDENDGTADLLVRETDDVRLCTTALAVVDWKFERQVGDPPDVRLQTMQYAVSAVRRFPALVGKAFLVYPLLREHQEASFDEARIAEWTTTIAAVRDRARAQVELPEGKREYRVGEHCGYCPARSKCPARGGELAAMAAGIGQHGMILHRDSAPTVYHMARSIRDAAELVLEWCKEQATGGEIVDDRGTLRIRKYMKAVSPSYKAAIEWLLMNGGADYAKKLDEHFSSLPKKPMEAIDFKPAKMTIEVTK